jgi:hypothetical protein
MFNHLANAQLVFCPDSGHASVFQYPELFVARLFLAISIAESTLDSRAVTKTIGTMYVPGT